VKQEPMVAEPVPATAAAASQDDSILKESQNSSDLKTGAT